MTAVIVLLLGIGGVALAGHQGRVETGGEAEDTAEQLLPSSDEASSAAKQNFVVGTLAATITGTLGGLILIPMKFEESYKQGLPYLPSFGLGVLLGAPIVTAIPFAVKGCAPPILPSDRTVPLLGIFSGILWNAANACSIMAIQSIGYSLAYPIMQCGLFVAGLWGILLFGDIRGRTPLAGYWLSGATLIVGATLLSLA